MKKLVVCYIALVAALTSCKKDNLQPVINSSANVEQQISESSEDDKLTSSFLRFFKLDKTKSKTSLKFSSFKNVYNKRQVFFGSEYRLSSIDFKDAKYTVNTIEPSVLSKNVKTNVFISHLSDQNNVHVSLEATNELEYANHADYWYSARYFDLIFTKLTDNVLVCKGAFKTNNANYNVVNNAFYSNSTIIYNPSSKKVVIQIDIKDNNQSDNTDPKLNFGHFTKTITYYVK